MFKRVLFVALFFLIAAPAMAQVQDNYLETSHTVACGEAQITLRNVSPWIYPVTVEVDGVPSYGPTVDNRSDTNGDNSPDLNGPQQDRSKTREIEFPEDSGVHTVRYRVEAGSENDLYRGLPVGEWTAFEVDSDCEPNVVHPTVDVTTSDATCDVAGDAYFEMSGSNETITVKVKSIPEPYVQGGEVFIYEKDYVFGDDDTHSFDLTDLEPGLYKITRDGNRQLKETFNKEFRISGPEDCQSISPTEPGTPATESTTPTTQPSTPTTQPSTPTTDPDFESEVASVGAEADGEVDVTAATLPFTGPAEDAGAVAAAASALILLGSALVFSKRRERGRHRA